jgi:opacity protein-like surface antigen
VLPQTRNGWTPFSASARSGNINEKWYLAGKSDIGGFGVGSDFAWSLQGTVGYNFTDKVPSEIGYRYLQTDYEDGAFTYDIAEHGFYLGLNVRF